MTMLAALLFATTAVLAHPFNSRQVEGRGCATHITEEQLRIANQRFDSFRVSSDSSIARAPASAIPVAWHVIYSGETETQGFLPEAKVQESVDALNEHYAGSGFSFVLQGEPNYVENAVWFSTVAPETSLQAEMKAAHRVGGPETLNIWSVGFEEGDARGLLGYATFPYSYPDAPTDDGVVLLHSTVPGGSTPNFDEGKTLTHEVGHWLGLYHVFQGGCSSSGDEVTDTPPQRTPTDGCPTSRDTCPGGGVDSVHNFMDYSYDSCMFEFTPGQVARAKEQTATFRGFTFDGQEPEVPSSTTEELPEETTTEELTTTEEELPPTETSAEPPVETKDESDEDECPWWFPWCWGRN